MRLVVVTPPEPIVSLDEAKAHLRVDGGDEDAYILGLVAAAQGIIDGPAGWLGRSLGPQVIELTAPDFARPGGFVLPCGPILAVDRVAYLDVAGTMQGLAPTAYALDGDQLRPAQGTLWPAVTLRDDAVRVRYRAGYAPTSDTPPKSTVPAPIVHAIKVMVAMLYENRIGDAAHLQTNPTVTALLGPYRVWSC